MSYINQFRFFFAFLSCDITLLCLYPQADVRDSVSKFMAFVHQSVNQMSKVYLTNERRYNYTTPKSFLELVSHIFITISALCESFCFLFADLLLLYADLLYELLARPPELPVLQIVHSEVLSSPDPLPFSPCY